jgi:hypothetical protein
MAEASGLYLQRDYSLYSVSQNDKRVGFAFFKKLCYTVDS